MNYFGGIFKKLTFILLCLNFWGVQNVRSQDWTHFLYPGNLDLTTTIVTSLSTDNSGNIWIGTGKGTYMYNHSTKMWNYYMGFNSPYQPSLVFNIHKTSSGKIYVCSEHGLALYNPSVNNWSLITTANGLSSNMVRDVATYGVVFTKLWVATQGGGACYYNGTDFSVYNTSDGLPSNIVYSVELGFYSDVWFGTSAGIAHYSGTNFTTYSTADGLPSNKVISSARGNNNTMWFGTDAGACSFDGNNWQAYTTADGLAGNFVYSVFTESNGDVWFTTNNGVSRYDGVQWETINTSSGLAGDTVYAMMKTGSEYWFGLHMKGVSILDNGAWSLLQNQQGLLNSQVNSITQDFNSRMWFGSNQGVSIFDGNTWSLLNVQNSPLPSNYVYCMLTDKTGNVWIGTNNGLVRCNQGLGFTIFNSSNGLPSSSVFKLFCDNSNNLWACTNSGVARIHEDNVSSFTVDDGLISNYVRSVAQDSAGDIWMTYNYSPHFAIFNGTSFSNQYAPDLNQNFSSNISVFSDINNVLWAYCNNHVFSKTKREFWTYIANVMTNINGWVHASDNSYWVTTNFNIYRYKNGNISSISNPGGLNTSYFQYIYSDQQGNLWISHNKGVSKVNPALITSVQTTSSSVTKLKVFPNPFTDNFVLQIETQSAASIEILMYSLSGSLVYSEKQQVLHQGIHDLKTDVSHLPGGTYAVFIILNGNPSGTLKIVKNN